MSASKQTRKVQLEVHTKDAAAEIFVIDGQFQLADRGLGYSKTFLLDPGIYTVKVRAGMETLERHVILRNDPVVEEFHTIDFASPAPLKNTAQTDDYHTDAAVKESREVHVEIGAGSYIYLFARDWTPPKGAERGFQATPSPHKGLTLRNAQGKVLVDFASQAKVDSHGDPTAACNVKLDPGSYRLSLELSTGARLEQMLVASEGWQTQVFLLQKDYAAPESKQYERQADLANSSILLTRYNELDQARGFKPSADVMRLVEQARIGLGNTRQVLPENIVDAILKGKFENPMLGIYGAHLLLLRDNLDTKLLRIVVGNLRRILGKSSHPDVEALALVSMPEDVSFVFNLPPMLQRSWWRVVDATVARPELVPQDSIASKVANHICGEGPWLMWLSPAKNDSSSKAYRAEELKQLKAMLASHAQMSSEQKSGGAEQGETREGSPFAGRVRGLAKGKGKAAAKSRSFSRSVERAESRSSTPEALATSRPLGEETIKKLVQQLGIPRSNLEHLLQQIKQKEDSEPD